MAFCPVCYNDTLMESEIYTSEDGLTEYCYDHCEYCGYHEEYDCEDDEESERRYDEMIEQREREHFSSLEYGNDDNSMPPDDFARISVKENPDA